MAVPMLCKVGLAVLAVSLRAQAQPYGGQAPTIPGIIQAELFDLGGEGVGYSDTTPENQPNGVFRPNEGVDIDPLGDGYNVGHIRAGEFLRYTVDVATDVGAFEFTFSVGSGTNTGSFRIVSGGTGCDEYTTDLSGPVYVPNTGGFNVYKDLKVSGKGDGGLAAGLSTIWLCVESFSFNLDFFTMTGGPYAGVPATVPGTIQAELFDLGGEGVGYSDTTPGNQPHGVFRPNDNVDIDSFGTGYNIGNMRAGEFLRYTVDVTTYVDAFVFTFRVGSETDTGSFRIVSGGSGCDDYATDLSGLVYVPNTGGFNIFDDLEVFGNSNSGLAAGAASIWLCVESSAFNIDYFIMKTFAYEGVPATVPGTVEAELFDVGGEGVGYSDTTAGNHPNGVFRPDEGVDIDPFGTGYNIGQMRAGEFLRYTVDVTTDVDAFLFNFSVGSGTDSGSFRIVSNGTGCDDYTTDLSGLVSVPNTGGYNIYENVEVYGNSNSGLTAGGAIIWLCVESYALNIDYFTMTSFAYQGVPATIPGTIEAELFDLGGEGVGYSDTTAANQPNGVFRPDEGVDIDPFGNGYNIGQMRAGEFLRYTLDVTADVDAFVFTFRVGSATSTGSFRIVSGGNGCGDYTTELSGLVSVPNTGGYNNYEDLQVSGNINSGLAAGASTIWLCVESFAFNIDYFTMTSFAYKGIPATVPGTIEAELFDLGGEGVGYSDTTAGNQPNGVFRPDEGVDIDPFGTGYNVGHMRAGEFLRYTVDVTTDVGAFEFTFRVGSATDTGSFRIVTGGTGCVDYTTDLSGLVYVPSTGGFNIYQDVVVSGDGNGGLADGLATIWLCVETFALNIDYFTMAPVP